jgi:N-carbamoylputrescine amidase
MDEIRIAAVVERATFGDPALNLERLALRVDQARRRGADLALFAELNLSGYAPSRGAAAPAEPLPGPLSGALQRIADRTGLAILAGVCERASAGLGYVSHLVVRPARPLACYRKLHLPPAEVEAFAAGAQVPLFDHCGWRFGVQLCFDAHFPELATRMALEGADALLIAHASPRGTPAEKLASWRRHLPARAFDNGLFVVACNQTGDNGAGLRFPGVALAIGPDGREISAYRAGRPGMLLVALRRRELERVRRLRMGYFLPHRRPALYQPGEAAGRPEQEKI